MKCFVSFACALSVLFAVCLSAPLYPQEAGISASTGLQVGVSASAGGSSGGGNPLTNILSNIDLPGLLRGVNAFVGVVRQFCPPLGQLLDNVIQNVTSTAFRVFGRAILQQGGLGGGGGGGGGGSVSVVLPTFPPDDEDYDDDEEDNNETDTGTSSSSSLVGDLRIGVNAKTTSSDPTTEPNSELVVNTTTSPLYTSPAEQNTIEKRHLRVAREAQEEFEEEEEEDDDQDGAESAPQPSQDLSADDQDRNKRFLPFGGSVDAHGSTGGSGNFLFDIIRNTADTAARAAGNVYKFVTGTQNIGWDVATTEEKTSEKLTRSVPVAQQPQLVAGSGATEDSDEKAHAPGGVAEVDIAGKGGHGGYTEGIPGPITRLFVIANRGLANLVQDLILRLAQTSEKFVNFKARLVTSLI